MSNFTFTNLPEVSVQSEIAVEEYNEPTQKTMSITEHDLAKNEKHEL